MDEPIRFIFFWIRFGFWISISIWIGHHITHTSKHTPMRGFLVFVIALQSTLIKGFLYVPCNAGRHFKSLMPPPLFISDNDIGSNANQEQSFPVPLGWERSSKSSTGWNSLDDPLSGPAHCCRMDIKMH